MRVDIIYKLNEAGNTAVVSLVQEDGPNWAGGTVVDALSKHLSGERTIKQIIVHPDVIGYDDPEPVKS